MSLGHIQYDVDVSLLLLKLLSKWKYSLTAPFWRPEEQYVDNDATSISKRTIPNGKRKENHTSNPRAGETAQPVERLV